MAEVCAGTGAGCRGERDPRVEAADAGQEGRGEGPQGPGEGTGRRGREEEGGRRPSLETPALTTEGGGREQVEVRFVFGRVLNWFDAKKIDFVDFLMLLII